MEASHNLPPNMPDSLRRSIEAQRARLNTLLGDQLVSLADAVRARLQNRRALDGHLHSLFDTIEHCKYLWVLDADGIQLSSTVNRFGADETALGRDRSTRPYMQHMVDEACDFKLSEAYISRNKKRPSVTAVQTLRDAEGRRAGFLGVDYDLRELPHTEVMYEEPSLWRQIKGDPAIRGGLFLQERVESPMDRQIDHVLSVHEALMTDQGIHHCQIHFSSSRSTIWHVDDPYVYRILTMDELSSTNICLALPRRPYFERSVVPAEKIPAVLSLFKALRFADDNIYLRSGSLNLVNGTIGLNFSCDGTHYLNFDDFLARGLSFWFGEGAAPDVACGSSGESQVFLDATIEAIAAGGCDQVRVLLEEIDRGQIPAPLNGCSGEQMDYIRQELTGIMQVYAARGPLDR